ncbi:MAG: hypothetical protein ACI4NI_09505 [Candidatus Ornithospirochaeta sp.]
MGINVLAYILALGLQIAGAVVMIIKYFKNTRKTIIQLYFPCEGIANNDGEDNAILEASKVQECVSEIYTNRIAFIYIAIGYSISILGDKQSNSELVLFISTAIVAIMLVVIEKAIVKFLSEKKYKTDLKVPYDELPGYIDTTASEKEIDTMVKDIFEQW